MPRSDNIGEGRGDSQTIATRGPARAVTGNNLPGSQELLVRPFGSSQKVGADAPEVIPGRPFCAGTSKNGSFLRCEGAVGLAVFGPLRPCTGSRADRIRASVPGQKVG
jgi:hypothetical protein